VLKRRNEHSQRRFAHCLDAHSGHSVPASRGGAWRNFRPHNLGVCAEAGFD
jgi:hypothetical protein